MNAKMKPKKTATAKKAVTSKKTATANTAVMAKKAVPAKKAVGKKRPKTHAIQLEIQSAKMMNELAEAVSEILWEHFQIECLRDYLQNAEILTHITDLSSLPSPHAEGTPEEIAQAVTQALADELPDAEVRWWVYKGVPKSED